jgi:hypothetical protein
MTRITPADVAEILDTELSEATLQAFVEDAHRIVNQRCAPYTDDDSALSAVETYVAAHLATAKDPQFSEVAHESVSMTKAIDDDGNDYWHQALLIDPTSRLARPNFTIATT